MPSESDVLAYKRDSKRRDAVRQIRRALLTAADGLNLWLEADAMDQKLKKSDDQLASAEDMCYTRHK